MCTLLFQFLPKIFSIEHVVGRQDTKTRYYLRIKGRLFVDNDSDVIKNDLPQIDYHLIFTPFIIHVKNKYTQ